jgi:hypothetical protein
LNTLWGSMAGTIMVAICSAAAFFLWFDGRSRRWLRATQSRKSESVPAPMAIADDLGARAALLLELVAAMLGSGASLPRALSVAADRFGLGETAIGRASASLTLGIPWDEAWPPNRNDPLASAVREGLHFAAATGAPSAQLISAHARLLRRQRHRELERRAATLGVRLVIPLGACSLPAFICLGVVPVLLSMAPTG